MPTYRLDVEYEGTRYHGWQEQQNARSVAGELRRAAAEAGGEVIELGGSGRTDAGVHAVRQTAHLRLRKAVELEAFRRAVNDVLPADIHVLSVRPAHDAFHARHDAVSRTYLYQIARRRTAFAKRHVYWVKRSLDVGAMARAAALLEGREYVTPDDVKQLAPPVLRHRVTVTPELELEGVTADAALKGILDQTEVPTT